MDSHRQIVSAEDNKAAIIR